MMITGAGRKSKAPAARRRRRRTTKTAPQRAPRRPTQTYTRRTTKGQVPKVIYVKAPPSQHPLDAELTRNAIWRGVQLPNPVYHPSIQPTVTAIVQPQTQTITPKPEPKPKPKAPPAVQEEEKWYDAPLYEEPIVKRSDGEADQDRAIKHKWNIDDVLDFLMKVPERTRKVVLISLFGTAVGAVIDLMLGSPLGLTSKIIRAILRIIPGGWIILNTFDGLGYLLGKGQEVLQITYDPGFVELAKRVQSSIPPHTAEEIAAAADRQLGGNTFTASLAALLHAVFLRDR
ncbi:hypothetical protein [Duck adenovirus 1]|nr:hypothetical protein [Duck adenovirus 1]